jgi:DNA adenine methylase
MLADIHERLAGVVIEQLPYAEVLRRYDGPATLFYLDPPYWGCESDYGDGAFERADFEKLAAQLGQLKGRFLLSINDNPAVRDVFKGFEMIEVPTTWTISTLATGGGKRVTELIVSGPR